MKRFSIIFFVLVFIVAGFFYVVKHQENGYRSYERQRVLMGTLFKIKVFGKGLSKKKFTEVTESAFSEIARLESEMSEWLPDSQISLIARFAGIRPVKVSDDVADIIARSLVISRQTGGTFDISFKPLGYLWNIGKRKAPPGNSVIQNARKLVGYQKIILNKIKKTVFLKQSGMSIGLGGIAKGYAAGKIADKMREAGINNFIINAGGDLYFSGTKAEKAWICGIKEPDDNDDIIGRFKIKTDCAVATSGNYERFFIYKGKRYHHIIDPRTGYPATGMKSVTVFSRNPACADAFATSFFILGYEKSLRIVQGGKQNIAFIMIDENNRILKSKNISAFAESVN